MVKIGLQIKTNLENCTNLKAPGDDFRWYLKMKCLNCGELSDKWVYVTQEEKVPLKGGRGEANFVVKCKLCSRENSADILSDSLTSYTSDDDGNFKTIIAFDCRGLDLAEFEPRDGWTVENMESTKRFAEVDLSEKEWYDYDDIGQTSVGICDLEYRFVKI